MRDPIHETGHGDAEVELHFKHVNEVLTANFKMPGSATLQSAWDEAYVKLGVDRDPKDSLQTAGAHPKPLASYLALSLVALKGDKIIDAYNFEIAGPTGGA